MNPPKLHALYGLKWNPFHPDVPVDALWRPRELDHFCWRIETLSREGGFALVQVNIGPDYLIGLHRFRRGARPRALF